MNQETFNEEYLLWSKYFSPLIELDEDYETKAGRRITLIPNTLESNMWAAYILSGRVYGVNINPDIATVEQRAAFALLTSTVISAAVNGSTPINVYCTDRTDPLHAYNVIRRLASITHSPFNGRGSELMERIVVTVVQNYFENKGK